MVQYQISVWSPIQLDHRWQLGLNLASQGCLKTSRGGQGVLLGLNQALLGTLYIAVPHLSVDRMLRMRTEWEPPMRGSKMFETQLRTNYP